MVTGFVRSFIEENEFWQRSAVHLRIVVFMAFFIFSSVRVFNCDFSVSASLGSLAIFCLDRLSNLLGCLVCMMFLWRSLASGFLFLIMVLLLDCIRGSSVDCAPFVEFHFSVCAFSPSCSVRCWSCFGNNSPSLFFPCGV